MYIHTGPTRQGTNSPRPLLVQLAKVHAKNLLMENLYILKHAEQKFKCNWVHLGPHSDGPARTAHPAHSIITPMHFLYYAFSLTNTKKTNTVLLQTHDTDTSSVNRHRAYTQTID